MVTSGYHLWQFQVFKSGAEGLVVVLFWLDLWEIFFLVTLGFEPEDLWISSPALHHCAWWHLVFTSDNFRYLTLVQRDWWWYCSDWTCESFSFGHIGVWTCDLWISIPALYHCTTVTSGFHLWQFHVFKSGAEGLVEVLFWLDLWEIFFLVTLGFEPETSGSLVLHSNTAPWLLLVFHLWQFQEFNSGAEWWVVVLFWLDLWEIFFLATLGFESKTSGSLVLHSNNVSWWLLVFTSDNFRYLTLVQRDWWWYCSDWTCERFSFWPQLGFDPVTSRSLVLHSTTAPRWLLVFTSWQFQVFNSGANWLVVVLFWLDLWEIFFLETL